MVKYAEGDVEGGLVKALAMVILKELAIGVEDMLLMAKTLPNELLEMVQG